MAVQEQLQEIPYERALRVIGRHFDGEPSYHISVLEVPDGFTTRWYPARHRSDGRSTHFSWDKVQDLSIFNSAGRNSRNRRQRHRGIWGNFPGGHEDFFRALGYVLDEERATALSIDEIADGVAVSYMRPIPGREMIYEKRHQVYHADGIQDMIVRAQGRREPVREPIPFPR